MSRFPIPKFSPLSLFKTDSGTAKEAVEEKQKPHATVAYPRSETNPQRMKYTSAHDSVMDKTQKAIYAERRTHDESLRVLNKRTQASANSSAIPGDYIKVDQLDYDPMYIRAAEKTQQTAMQQGLRMPKQLSGHEWRRGQRRQGELSYSQDMYMRGYKSFFKDLKRAEPKEIDPAAHALTGADKARRLEDEEDLIFGKIVFDTVSDHVTKGALKMLELFVPNSDLTDLELAPQSVDELTAFFKQHFGKDVNGDDVPFDKKITKNAQRAFTRAGTDSNAQKKVLKDYLDKLVAQVPYSTRWNDEKWSNPKDGEHGGSIFELARAYAKEAMEQQKIAEESTDSAINVDGTSWLVRKDDMGDLGPGDFKLWQPYGQKDGQKTAHQVLFKKQEDGSYQLKLERVKYFIQKEVEEGGRKVMKDVPVSSAGLRPEDKDAKFSTTKEEISLGEPGQEMETLRHFFTNPDLKKIFGDGSRLTKTGFSEYFGKLRRPENALKEKTQDIAYHHMDEERDQYIEETNMTSEQEPGFAFNNALYGKLPHIDSRRVCGNRFSKSVPVKGFCGTIQREGDQMGWHTIALEHIPPYRKFLNGPHGGEAYHLNEDGKDTLASLEEGSAVAGVHETPLEEVRYNQQARRGAEPGKPVAQTKDQFPLLNRRAPGSSEETVAHRQYLDKSEPSRLANTRKLYELRDAQDLNVKVKRAVTVEDPDTGEVKKTMVHDALTFEYKGKRIQASPNLKPSSAVMKDGSVMTLDEHFELTADFLKNCQSLKMKHEMPEGWVLRDDEKRVIYEKDENGKPTKKPVRLLEEITIEPKVEPAVIHKGVYAKDKNGVEQPAYLDKNGTRVFREEAPVSKENEFLHRTRGLREYVYKDANGNPAMMPVKRETISEADKDDERISLNLVGYERWVRKPLPKTHGSKAAKLKGDKALCTYQKEKQSAGDRQFDPHCLRDRQYYKMNCVHSQNLFYSEYEPDVDGVEVTGYSVMPNDELDMRNQMEAGSAANRRTHAVPHVPGWMRERNVLEHMQLFVLGLKKFRGKLVVKDVNQPHKDLNKNDAGVNLGEDHLTVHRGEVLPENHGQRQGNKEGALAGLVNRDLNMGLFPSIDAAGASSGDRNALGLNEAALKENQRAKILFNQLRDSLQNYSLTRDKAGLSEIVAKLRESEHPILMEAADALVQNGDFAVVKSKEKLLADGETVSLVSGVQPEEGMTMFDRIDASLRAYNATLDPNYVLYGSQNMGTVLRSYFPLQEKVKQLADSVNAIKKAREQDRAPDGGSFRDQVIHIQSLLNEIFERTERAFPNKQDGDAKQCFQAFRQLSHAINELAAWECLPTDLMKNVSDALRQEQDRIIYGIEHGEILSADEHNITTANTSNINGLTAAQIDERNMLIKTRHDQPPYKQIYALFSLQDHTENSARYKEERAQYWASKDALVRNLAEQYADITDKIGEFKGSPLYQTVKQYEKCERDLSRIQSSPEFKEASRRDGVDGKRDETFLHYKAEIDAIGKMMKAIEDFAEGGKAVKQYREYLKQKTSIKSAKRDWENFERAALRKFEMGTPEFRNEWMAKTKAREEDLESQLSQARERLSDMVAGTDYHDLLKRDFDTLVKSPLYRTLRKTENELAARLESVRKEISQAERIEDGEALREFDTWPKEKQSERVGKQEERVSALEKQLKQVDGNIAMMQRLGDVMAALNDIENAEKDGHIINWSTELSAADRNRKKEELQTERLRILSEIDEGGTEDTDDLSALFQKKTALASKLSKSERFLQYARSLMENTPVPDTQPAQALVQMGRVAKEDDPANIHESETPDKELEREMLTTELVNLLASGSSDKRNAQLKKCCDALIDMGLIDHADIDRDKVKEAMPALLQSQDFGASFQSMNQVVGSSMESARLFAQLQTARQMAQDYLDAPQQDKWGREKQFRPYPAKGWQLPPGPAALMATNDLLKSAFEGIKAIAEKTVHGAHAHETIEVAAAGANVGADVVPVGLQLMAGAMMAKDGAFEASHLRSLTEDYRKNSESLEADLKKLLADWTDSIASVPEEDRLAQSEAIAKTKELLTRELNALDNRQKLLDQNFKKAVTQLVSGVVLGTGGLTTLASTVMALAAKLLPLLHSAASASAKDASGILPLAAAPIYTLLTALQMTDATVDKNRLKGLKDQYEELAFERGLGVVSGLRVAGFKRLNERIDAAEYKQLAWGLFGMGSLLAAGGGGVTVGTKGAALPVSVPLVALGGLMMNVALAMLYKMPKDLRGKDARSAYNTPHMRGSFANTDRRLNQIRSCNNDKLGALAEFVQDMDNEKNEILDAKQRKKLKSAIDQSWWRPAHLDRVVREFTLETIDKSVPEQSDLMRKTLVAEINLLDVEVQERFKDLEILRSQLETNNMSLGKNIQSRKDLELEASKLAEKPISFEARDGESDTAWRDELKELSAEDLAQVEQLKERYDALKPSAEYFQSNADWCNQQIKLRSTELKRAEMRYKEAYALMSDLNAILTPELATKMESTADTPAHVKLWDAERKEQRKELYLRWLVSQNVLFAALEQKGALKLAQANNDRQGGLPSQLPHIMTVTVDGVAYDGKTKRGQIPKGGKFEFGEIYPSEETFAFLKEHLDDQIDDLFARSFECIRDQANAELSLAVDTHLENMKKDKEKKEALIASEQAWTLAPLPEKKAGKPEARIESVKGVGQKGKEPPSVRPSSSSRPRGTGYQAIEIPDTVDEQEEDA